MSVEKCLNCPYLGDCGCEFSPGKSTAVPGCDYNGTLIGLLTGHTTMDIIADWHKVAVEAVSYKRELK